MSFLAEITLRKSLGQTAEEIRRCFFNDVTIAFPESTPVPRTKKTKTKAALEKYAREVQVAKAAVETNEVKVKKAFDELEKVRTAQATNTYPDETSRIAEEKERLHAARLLLAGIDFPFYCSKAVNFTGEPSLEDRQRYGGIMRNNTFVLNTSTEILKSPSAACKKCLLRKRTTNEWQGTKHVFIYINGNWIRYLNTPFYKCY
jgi:hypothetical protein